MEPHKIVSREEWLVARKAHLAREKAFTRARDELSRDRRELPWVRLDKAYVFDGPHGKVTLGDLFGARRQLIVIHFMFGPDDKEGCPICSFRADGFDGMLAHLNARDVSFAVVSRAPIDKLQAFRQRMGWGFNWVSSFESDFNFDFQASFTKADVAAGEVYYNYDLRRFPVDEAHGASVFYKEPDRDEIFHTYSCYARGSDLLMSTYNYLDLVPKGRDEAGLPFSMSWVRHHDRYPEGRPVVQTQVQTKEQKRTQPPGAIAGSDACCHEKAQPD
jgi:predicted dithiol-disulfide oxidoreductase (DUF899 family)